MTPKEVIEFAKKNDVRQIDLRFTDLPGLTHHISYPISQLSESSFEEGFGIDGSSIRGWAAINESDMLLIPDPKTGFIDPFGETKTLVMIGDIKDPITKQSYERDPRYIAKKAELFHGVDDDHRPAAFLDLDQLHDQPRVIRRRIRARHDRQIGFVEIVEHEC